LKILIFDFDENRAAEIAQSARQFGFQAEMITSPVEINQREQFIAAFITQESESPAWYDLISQLAAKGVAAYLVGEPSLEAYRLMPEIGGSGLVNWNNAGIEAGNYLKLLAQGQGGAGKAGRSLRQPLKRSAPAPVSAGVPNAMRSVSAAPMQTPAPMGGAGLKLPGRQEPSPNRASRRRRRSEEGKDTLRDQIVVIYSPKGGVGKSTFSVNFAFSLVSLLKDQKIRPVLVDLDTSFGNIASMLDLRHQANLINWIKSDFKEDFSNLVVQHESGLDILLAPPNPLESGAITAEVVDKMLYTLNKRYDFVVVDTNPSIKLHHTKAFEWADTVVLLGTTQKPTLKDVRAMDGIFDQLKIDKSKVKFVLNMVPKQPSINVQDAINEIPFQCIGLIPEDAAVKVEENRGSVACLSRRAKSYTQAHIQVCNKILGRSVIQNRWENTGFADKLKGLFGR